MKYLLTSGGITNTSIHHALEHLLGNPIAESSALYIPTSLYANPNGSAMVARLIQGSPGMGVPAHHASEGFAGPR